MTNKTLSIARITWLTLAAVSVPVWAIANQYHVVTVPVAEEDQCPEFNGVYALDNIDGVNDRDGHHVLCRYK